MYIYVLDVGTGRMSECYAKWEVMVSGTLGVAEDNPQLLSVLWITAASPTSFVIAAEIGF